jgi:hypothetical protein
LPVGCAKGLLPIHTGAERREFLLEERLINPGEPVGRELNGSGIPQMRESQARPGPVHGVLDQPRADWIAKHIAEDGEEMAVLLNRKTLKPALPHMAMTSVMAMVAADVAGHPPLHEGAQGGVGGWLDDQVEMIGHQADAEDFYRVVGFRHGEQVEKRQVVAVFVEYGRAPVAPIEYMVGVSGNLSTRNPRHRRRTVRQLESGRKIK